MDRSRIADKVRKLLAMAGDASSPNEAAIAAMKAQQLIEEHRLSMGEIELTESTAQVFTFTTKVRRLPAWHRELLNGLCALNGCSPGWRARLIALAGREEDVHTVAYLFKYLTKEIDRLAAKGLKTEREKSHHPITRISVILRGQSSWPSTRVELQLDERSRREWLSQIELKPDEDLIAALLNRAVRSGEVAIEQLSPEQRNRRWACRWCRSFRSGAIKTILTRMRNAQLDARREHTYQSQYRAPLGTTMARVDGDNLIRQRIVEAADALKKAADTRERPMPTLDGDTAGRAAGLVAGRKISLGGDSTKLQAPARRLGDGQ